LDFPAQQRQKQHRVVAESESEADEDSACAADGGYGWLISRTPSPLPPQTPCFDFDLWRQEGVRPTGPPRLHNTCSLLHTVHLRAMQSWSCARATGPPGLHNTCSLLHTVHLRAMQSWSCARATGPPRLHNTCSLLHTVHLRTMLLCAEDADADAGADVTFAAAAADPDSHVEAMTGELRSRCLDGDGGVGSWCCSVLACMVCANRFDIVAAGLQRLALPWDNPSQRIPSSMVLSIWWLVHQSLTNCQCESLEGHTSRMCTLPCLAHRIISVLRS
jgi:hypothetical protein